MFWFRLFSYRQTPSKSYSKWKLASIWRSLEMFQIWIHIQTKQKKWDYARILKFLGIFMSNKVSFCELCFCWICFSLFCKHHSRYLIWCFWLVGRTSLRFGNIKLQKYAGNERGPGQGSSGVAAGTLYHEYFWGALFLFLLLFLKTFSWSLNNKPSKCYHVERCDLSYVICV